MICCRCTAPTATLHNVRFICLLKQSVVSAVVVVVVQQRQQHCTLCEVYICLLKLLLPTRCGLLSLCNSNNNNNIAQCEVYIYLLKLSVVSAVVVVADCYHQQQQPWLTSNIVHKLLICINLNLIQNGLLNYIVLGLEQCFCN